MSTRPSFGRQIKLGSAAIAAANTARDGSGSLVKLLTAGAKYTPVTADVGNELISVSNWSQLSSSELGRITNGDAVRFVSGTMPTGAVVDTDYMIGGLDVDTATDIATFYLIDTTTEAIVALSGSPANLVMALPEGTRIDQIVFTSAQASLAAVGSKVFCAFVKRRASTAYDLVGNVALTGTTPSTTVASPSATITFTNGLALEYLDEIWVSQSVYAGVQDRTVAVAYNGVDY